ncbi:N6-adenosine-methyltransferase subunit METTL3, partial [Rhincodon typus]|uniref:N6-adenosine-methyltransferase subunit METTL3 n=1 Tax=Rhincodon typus TaxID=259920 RepID=UPI0020307DC8
RGSQYVCARSHTSPCLSYPPTAIPEAALSPTLRSDSPIPQAHTATAKASNQEDDVRIDPQLEKNILEHLSDPGLVLPTDSIAIKNALQAQVPCSVSQASVESLLQKFSIQELIQIRAAPCADGHSLTMVTWADHAKLSAMAVLVPRDRGPRPSEQQAAGTKRRLEPEGPALALPSERKVAEPLKKSRKVASDLDLEIEDLLNQQSIKERRIINKHTDKALGDCSFLNTCFHMDTCKYIHYEIDSSMDDAPCLAGAENCSSENALNKEVSNDPSLGKLFPPQVRHRVLCLSVTVPVLQVGVKGNPQGFNRGLDCDVIVAEVRSTSHKPDEIYGMIERLSPGTRKIELFGRPHNVQPNWITLGNQLDGIHLLDPDVVARFKKGYPNGVITKVKNL